MEPNQWIYLLIGGAVVSCVLFIYFLINDSKLIRQANLKGRHLVLDWMLLIIGVAFIGLAVFTYIDIQNQIHLFT
ncbi:hypothetical protein [Enterococcus hulanensis]|uniref:hypothetical protein n=1 Tax=Enterococcus hulanensis TaxID=2559929 RepID=UPI0010F531E4|nr:hypothetical protein [Enterococcus hulanensis]